MQTQPERCVLHAFIKMLEFAECGKWIGYLVSVRTLRPGVQQGETVVSRFDSKGETLAGYSGTSPACAQLRD